MAINFAGFPTANYLGTPYGQAIATGMKPPIATGPKTVRMDIEWSQYGASSTNQQIGVTANLFQQSQQTAPLDYIRSIFIDNTFVSVPVYVQFADTLQTLLCPPFGQAMHPVFTYQQQFTIFGDGFQDGDVSKTVLFFSNVDRQGYYVPVSSTGGNFTPIIFAKEYNVSVNTSGNFTLMNVPLGDEDADRVICVTFASSRTNGDSIAITGVTIAGVGAVLREKAIGGAGIANVAEIWSAVVPTGTTGNITVTASGSGTMYIRGCVYSIRNLASPTPISNADRTAGGNASLTVTVDGRQNGVVIACGTKLDPGFGWIGVQENFAAHQFTSGTADFYGASASALTNTNAAVNVSMTGRALAAVSFE